MGAEDDRDNRREGDRMPILGDLRGEVMVFQPMGITELGAGGVQVETTFPLHLDSLHDLRLELGTQTIILKGRVTYCSITDVNQELVRYRSGIQFVDVPERAAAVIVAFLGRVTGERRAPTE
jgi:PilZ domain